MPDDLAKLQGAWTLQSLELDGKPMPPAGGIEISGDRFHTTGMGGDYTGTVELDESTKPKRLDLIFIAGPEEGNRNRGIYHLDGDTWKICLDIAGKSRPRAFSSAPRSGVALEIFARAQVAAGPVPDDEGVPSDPALLGEWELLEAAQSGQKLDPRSARTGRRVTTATHTTTYFGAQIFRSADYVANPTQLPKTIDLHSNGQTELGIYDLDGDTMRVCFAAPGDARPANFETRPGDGRTYAAWRRTR